ncbi:tetratricopeptide repeat protein [bacterium]|nr:tetratricopeptide repeat protein [bacterium]
MTFFHSFKKNKATSTFAIFACLSLQNLFASGASSYEGLSQEEGFVLRRITEFWKDEDYQMVKKEIHKFHKTHKNSEFCDELYGNLGDILIQEGKYQEALSAYQNIRNPKVSQKFVINTMQCYYELEQYEDLVDAGLPFVTKMTKELVDRKDELYFLVAEGYFRSALHLTDGDKKNTRFNKALPLYEKILNSSFHNPTTFALAEIYRIQGAHDKAATFFLELAGKHPDREEELLFHAALAQAEFNKAAAIDTFSKVMALSGEKCKDAAINRLILYFSEEQFGQVIKGYDEVLSLAGDEKRATLEYIVARSHFAQKEYEKANTHLESFIAFGQGTKDEQRNAILMQLSTAQFLKNEKTYRTMLEKLASEFPNDPELSQAIFIHAMMLKEEGKAREAEGILTKLVKGKHNIKNQEVLQLEYGLVAYNNQNWSLAKKTLQSFTQKYEESSHSPVAWKYLLSSALNLLKSEQDNKQQSYSKKEFLQDLDTIMTHAEVLDAREKEECLFLQGKLSYELQKYDGALSQLGTFVFDHPKSGHLPEAYLLIALCHHKRNDTVDLFCTNAEKAIQLDPTLAKKSALHLELFNAYLTIANEGKNKDMLTKKAREHLFAALSLGEKDIKLENQLWLANSYLDDLALPLQTYAVATKQSENDVMFHRCFSLFEGVLAEGEEGSLTTIDNKHSFLEWEVIKYAKLLGNKGQPHKKIQILKSLIENQTEKKRIKWEAKEEALFELAKTYEELEKKSDALDIYSFLASTDKGPRTFVQEYAKLNALRLAFAKLTTDERKEDTADVLDILSSLKDIQIKKSPSSEPLHLEAALEYAKIRGIVTSSEQPHVKYLFFLGRIREDFTDSKDPAAQKYLQEIASSNEKKALFDRYMKYIDAETLRMEAIIKAKDGHMAMSYELSGKAKNLLEHLEKEPLSIYLLSRVKESKELLQNGAFL